MTTPLLPPLVMTDEQIRQAAQLLDEIEHHRREAKEHQRKADLHVDRITEIRAALEILRSGRDPDAKPF